MTTTWGRVVAEGIYRIKDVASPLSVLCISVILYNKGDHFRSTR